MRIVVATAWIERDDVDALRERLGPSVTITHLPLPWHGAGSAPTPLSADWLRTMRDADVVVGYVPRLSELLEQPGRLALVQHIGAGLDAIDVERFRRTGIGLVSASGVAARSVGDFAVAALMALALRHPERVEAQRQHRWEHLETAELQDLRVLVVGAGPIGSRICAIAGALGIEVVVARRRPQLGAPAGARAVIGLADLPSSLPAAGALMLAIALGPQTSGLIGAAELARLPPGALVVNVGRGALLDERALADALRAGHLGGAWLDVFEHEPLPAQSPLWDVPNLRISAHDATAAIGLSRRLADRACETVLAWRAGRPIAHVVVEPDRPAPSANVEGMPRAADDELMNATTDLPAEFLGAISHGDFATARSLAAPDFSFSTQHSGEVALEPWLDLYRRLLRAIPDLHFAVSDIEEDGDRVTGVLRTTGTHTGTLDLPALGVEGLAPTGATLDLPSERFAMTVADGRIERIVSRPPSDGGLTGLLRQLGAER